MTPPNTANRAAFSLDRERGILTTADRRYLLGQSDIEPGTQAERDTRQRIRNRVYNSLLDFEILLQHMEPRDRQQVFEKRSDSDPEHEWAVLESVDATVGFLVLGLADLGQMDREFAKHIENGIRRAYAEREIVLDDVNCTVEVQEGEPYADLDQNDLNEIPITELQQLLTAKKISPEEFADAVKAKED